VVLSVFGSSVNPLGPVIIVDRTPLRLRSLSASARAASATPDVSDVTGSVVIVGTFGFENKNVIFNPFLFR
jgi:hypothetical protein